MNRRPWLEIAEYASLATSAAGTIAAVMSSQVAYAAAPLTVALSLNVVNRHRLQQEMRQYTNNTVANVHQVVNFEQEKKIETLTQQFNGRAELQIEQLKQALAALPASTVDLDSINQSLEQLKQTVEELTRQFNARPEAQAIAQLKEPLKELLNAIRLNKVTTEQDKHMQQRLLETSEQLARLRLLTVGLNERTEHLLHRTSNLDKMQKQLTSLQQLVTGCVKTEDLEGVLATLSKQIAGQFDTAVDQQLVRMNQLLKEIQPQYEYKLVYERDESRYFLLKAATEAQERLIIVSPWLHWGIRWNRGELLEYFTEFLKNRKGCIDIGWGHRTDIDDDKIRQCVGSIRQRLKAYSSMYSELESLEKLEKEYPNQFKLKLLGTHEKYLVCDHSWAMLGSHNILSSGGKSKERELGLRTNDPRIIAELIERFRSAENLEVD